MNTKEYFDFPIKSKFWKLIPRPDIDMNKAAQILANYTTEIIKDQAMIGIPKDKSAYILVNYLEKKQLEEMSFLQHIFKEIYPCTQEKIFNLHEQFDWYITHHGLTTTGMDVTTLSPF